MRAQPPGRGPSFAWLGAAALLLPAVRAGEVPVPAAPAPPVAPAAATWVAVVLSLLACAVAVAVAVQARRVLLPGAATESLETRLDELSERLERLEKRLSDVPSPELDQDLPDTPAPEPEPDRVSREPFDTPRRLADELLAVSGANGDALRLQAFLRALLTIPAELERLLAASPGEVQAVVRNQRVALDQALYQRWSAEAMAAAGDPLVGAGDVDWEALARWVRERQDAAVAALAAGNLHRFAPQAMTLLSPDTAVASDEPPVATNNADLRDRVAEVTPGNGGWRLGNQVICPARARLYEWREA